MVDAFLQIAERLGIPTAILVIVAVLLAAIVKGPLTRFAEVLAAPIAQLIRSHIEFVSKATARLEAIPGQIELEGEKTRHHVSEQVAGAVRDLGGQVVDVERAVTATGPHQALRASQGALEAYPAPSASSPAPEASGAPTQPDRPDKPRPPMGTLPSASELSPARA
jgi:hypothetical protein